MAGLSGSSLKFLVGRTVALVVIGFAAVAYVNSGTGRGIGWMFVFFLVLVAVMHYVFTRTKFGRALFAVGGNEEAAAPRRHPRRARVRGAAAFILSSTFAATGGILGASRLAAVNQRGCPVARRT